MIAHAKKDTHLKDKVTSTIRTLKYFLKLAVDDYAKFEKGA